MRIGIDTYSYHRLLGAPRPGEAPARRRLSNGGPPAIAQARALECEVVSIQTCFLPPSAVVDGAELGAAAGEMEVILAWGHPEGLAFGRDDAMLEQLCGWINVANALGSNLMRIVVGGPALRGVEPVAAQITRTIEPLARAAAEAHDRGLRLAIENHGDLASEELIELVERVDCPNVGVCFDTANALRVGEDAVAAAERLAGRIWMIHLKDIESPSGFANRIAGPCSVPFGEGVVPVAAILETLEGPVDAGCPVCVEVGQVASGIDECLLVERCVRWLQGYRHRTIEPRAHHDPQPRGAMGFAKRFW